jgi:hypothetical protein
VYQLDDDFEDEQFYEITLADSADFSDVISTSLDFEIRIVLWSKRGAFGLRTTIVDALRKTYGLTPPKHISRAIKKMRPG